MSPTLEAPALDRVRTRPPSPVTQASRVAVVDSDDWRTRLIRELQELARLPHNWDTYGSPPPFDAAVRVLDLLDKFGHLWQFVASPSVSPTSGGGIGLTWQRGSRELELEVRGDGELTYLKVEDDEESEEEPISSDRIDQLSAWLLDI